MKKKIDMLSYFSLLLVSLILQSCSGDSTGWNPEDSIGVGG